VGQTIGRFEVIRLLGEGGSGAVYLAEHTIIKTRVAIKVLTGLAAQSAEIYARFVREARATNTIISPHVPRYYDFGQLSDLRPYAVMEYFEGETLAAYLARRGPLPLRDAVTILRQLAAGMCAAHDAGVIHRDLKPDNVFVVLPPGGALHVVILDFGIAKLLGPSESGAGATRAGLFIGTPQYCAPEQVSGTSITGATDVYALGVIAFELLTGQRPFDGDGLEPLGTKLAGPAPSLDELMPELPRSVVADIALMLERNPADRIATMKVALGRIDAWSRIAAPDTATLSATPLPTRVLLDLARPRRRSPVVLGCALFGGVAFGAGWLAHRDSPASLQPVVVIPEVPAPTLPTAPLPQPPLPPTPVTASPIVVVTAPAVPAPKPQRPRPARSKPSDVIVADPFK
jgi:serine/threonine-protein kinase